VQLSERWSGVLGIIGLVGMLLGGLDPLEGSFIIVPGACLVALAAFLGKLRLRALFYGSLALVAVGAGAMWTLTAIGGIGGSTGRSMWWGLSVLPLAVGWVMALVSGALTLREALKRRGMGRSRDAA
jgi:hypothetical protein